MPLAPQDIRTFFVTSVTADRRRLFQIERNAQLFTDILIDNRAKGRFLLHAYVIMPDHFHLILTPSPDIPLEKAIQYIKGGFSFRLKNESKFEVWEKSFREHRIKSREDYAAHLIYTEQNPVKKFLAQDSISFPFSSASNPAILDPAPGHLASGPHG